MSELLNKPTKTSRRRSAPEPVISRTLMQQWTDGATARSPLYGSQVRSEKGAGGDQPGVFFTEQPLLGHITLRGNRSDAAFMDGCQKALGVSLPDVPLSSVQHEDLTILSISPDEWLIILPGAQAFALEQALHSQVATPCSIVNVSGGQTVFELSGPDVRRVLQKSMTLDLHPDAFPVGKVASSHFAKSTATILRTGEDSYRLVVRRSFSDYLWRWIRQASLEYGLQTGR